MNYLILFLLSSFPLSLLALEQTPTYHCKAVTQSKTYLSGQTSTNYPKHVKFKCQYICQTPSRTKKIWGTSALTVRNQRQDMLNIVCQGVKLKKVSWGYDFDRVVPFYGFDAETPEVKKWANKNLTRQNPIEEKKLLKFKGVIKEILESYDYASQSQTSSAQSFKNAHDFLFLLFERLPYETDLLDQSIQTIKESRPLIKEDKMANSLIYSILNTQAKWRF